MDLFGIKVYDAQSERILWEKKALISTSQVPIVADDKIYLATTEGEMITYDIVTGSSSTVKYTANIDSQPVYNKGFLYVVSAGVLTAIKSVKDFKWNQWNKDATHNLRID
jgi:outer membrane protein assembly factor BamB